MSEMTPERVARALACGVVFGDELARTSPSDAQEPRDDGDDPGGGRSPELAE